MDDQLLGAGMRATFENALAVRHQIRRLRSIDLYDPWVHAHRAADAHFLIIALWRLRMAAGVCASRLPEGSVEGLLAAFDNAVPETRAMRNVVMHYDNYLLENDKRLNVVATTGMKVKREDVESLHPSPDGLSWLGRNYTFDDIDAAAVALYQGLNQATGIQGWE